MLVMKFGGSSVANREQIDKVRHIVAGRIQRRPIVVCSAHRGITNLLIDTAEAAARGEYAPERVIDRQREIATELGCPGDLLDPLFSEIRDLLRGISLVKELSPRSLDYISSFGERMSVRCIADFLGRHGVPASAHDVFDLGFITDSNFNRARPIPGWESGTRRSFANLPEGVVPVVTGFVGKNEAGEITTVGRNGSDLTATLLSAALGADEVEIWTDTDGVMTADPSLVKTARNIPIMRFDEAAELAYFGSRVLHPSTLLPAMGANIPVRVMNTNRPDHPGTVIDGSDGDHGRPITSIAYKEGQTVLVLNSTRMFGESGFLARFFAILGRHDVVIDMVSTSEVAVSVTTDDQPRLAAALPELRELGEVTVLGERALLVVVGRHLATRAGLGATVMRAIADAGVNVEMVSHSVGSINISMMITDADIDRAVSVLHDVLFTD